MTVDLEQIKENSMVRYGFKILLMREFGITIRETETQKLMQAADCIEIYVFHGGLHGKKWLAKRQSGAMRGKLSGGDHSGIYREKDCGLKV